ncbi:MAG TPA: TonB family protein [Candidatus Sulfotelmatobacter sp.]|nr:TonB family protein [Candidatus Sulfotelmatobacter sp.]
MGPSIEAPQSEAVPRLLVELPSRALIFRNNLRDLLFSRRLPPLELNSAPADFWPDVFVHRPLPWSRFLQSGIYHVLAGTAVIALGHLFALQPRVVQPRTFDHSQIVYYQAAEYLPALDTRARSSARPQIADPEFSPQPLISVPRESDNRSQTIVAPPKIKLKRDISMPNVVAWSDAAQKPRLAIPDSPLIPASEIRRLTPSVENSVVKPPPDAAKMDQRRDSPVFQTSVVAPPPELKDSPRTAAVGLQPALIAPPPAVDTSSDRRPGDINIGPSRVVAPAPRLPLEAQRSMLGGGRPTIGTPQVVPPPPSVGASGPAARSPGRLIALNLHPAVGAPSDPPAGNRRGTFAATPEGHRGASGAPGTTGANTSGNAGGSSANSSGSNASRNSPGNLPTGLYVGTPAAHPAPIAGNSASQTPAATVNPNLIAGIRPPRITSSHTMQPESTTKLTEPERAVFGNRRFYSVSLNMPNLNSGGGSWVIRFAELRHDSGPRGAASPPADLSQPMATRKVDPAYPLQLMRQNVAGTVILYAVIHADGTVGNIRVLRGVDDRLDRYASDALTKWKFDPATKNGEPVDVEATFQIPFKPTRVGTNF